MSYVPEPLDAFQLGARYGLVNNLIVPERAYLTEIQRPVT